MLMGRCVNTRHPHLSDYSHAGDLRNGFSSFFIAVSSFPTAAKRAHNGESKNGKLWNDKPLAVIEFTLPYISSRMMMSILTVVAIIVLVAFAICRFLGPRAQQFWFRSSGEEKIGLSKNKLYNANGYIVSVSYENDANWWAI